MWGDFIAYVAEVGNGGIDPAWVALGGTVLGTIGLKIAESILGKGRVKIDDASKIRDELRQSVETQRKEITELDKEVDRWKKDYYDLRDQLSETKTKLTMMEGNHHEEKDTE